MTKLVEIMLLFLTILKYSDSHPTQVIQPNNHELVNGVNEIPQSSATQTVNSENKDILSDRLKNEELRAKRETDDDNDDYILERRYGGRNRYYLVKDGRRYKIPHVHTIDQDYYIPHKSSNSRFNIYHPKYDNDPHDILDNFRIKGRLYKHHEDDDRDDDDSDEDNSDEDDSDEDDDDKKHRRRGC
ncbi:CLUMA_CG018684, isoform A [Clunio marinus]|uniref:CLUMA_CG018684, isoform A n=1 Tax=Clunio marinus TaxID=568069 RepID=A0A1J1IZZ5_9DIPT|nr:CLUMA_CG018684, isoform A [Clunio marinus]